MSIAAIVAALVAAGATPEMILAAVRAAEAAGANVLEKRRASDRARQAKRRGAPSRESRENTESRDVTVTSRDIPSPSASAPDGPLPPDPSPPLTPPPPPAPAPLRGSPSSSLRSDDAHVQGAGDRERWPAEGFDQFWRDYPHKVGKDAARKSFDRLRKRRDVSLADLLAGIDRYKRFKPPDRDWCNPATWLNQGRWEDEPAFEEAPIHERPNSQHSPVKGPGRATGHDTALAYLRQVAAGETDQWSGPLAGGSAPDRGRTIDHDPHPNAPRRGTSGR